MKILFRLSLCLSLWALFVVPGASGQSLKKAFGDSKGQPIVIKSDTLEFDHQRKRVTFSGNVDAKRDDWTIVSQEMVVYYSEKNSQSAQKDSMKIEKLTESTQKGSMKIERIVAKGDVRITRQSG
ncbi:MAG: hypothetical protein MUC98_05570, partial [Desulfobacterota bacterium]|nr:hypothetical protein [Thermodesulfobacteriota bacterium]